MLADTKILLNKANKGHYAIGHFNINNMEIVQGVVQAGAKLKAPLILATSEGAVEYAGMNFLYDLAVTASSLVNIPIALHLDHGRNVDLIKKAIRKGYSSVMVDGSHLPFAQNVRLTKSIVALAHRKGIPVEAELGTIGGVEDTISSRKILYTDPDQAKEFVDTTDCDFLAVALGTSHGAYKFKGKVQLHLHALRKIKEKTKIPLVLHGASGVPKDVVAMAERYGANLPGVEGVPDSQIRKAVLAGINKVNTDTDLRLAFDAGVRKALQEAPQDFDPRHILAPARTLIQSEVERRIKMLGSDGRC